MLILLKQFRRRKLDSAGASGPVTHVTRLLVQILALTKIRYDHARCLRAWLVMIPQQQIHRLQVAVQNAMRVQMCQSHGDVQKEGPHVTERQLVVSANVLVQIAAVRQFHQYEQAWCGRSKLCQLVILQPAMFVLDNVEVLHLLEYVHLPQHARQPLPVVTDGNLFHGIIAQWHIVKHVTAQEDGSVGAPAQTLHLDEKASVVAVIE